MLENRKECCECGEITDDCLLFLDDLYCSNCYHEIDPVEKLKRVMMTGGMILGICFFWILGVDYYLKGLYDLENDAVGFLYLYLQNNNFPQIGPLILKWILIFFFIVIVEWLLFNLIKRIEETIKKNIIN